MGVSGAGKTTVGRLLAEAIGWKFFDADSIHSPQNIAKMQAGIPLTDEDREPWLEELHDAIAGWIDRKENVVLACSALKKSYREMLLLKPEVKLVFLQGSYALIEHRLEARKGHFMDPDLLESQFETLELPEGAIIADVSTTPTAIVNDIRQKLGPILSKSAESCATTLPNECSSI
jgi:gluconokinase